MLPGGTGMQNLICGTVVFDFQVWEAQESSPSSRREYLTFHVHTGRIKYDLGLSVQGGDVDSGCAYLNTNLNRRIIISILKYDFSKQ